MKRILIICLVVIGFISLKAQDVFVPINYSALEKKVLKSNEEITDPKKSIDPKTWIRRGEIMLSVYDIDLEQIYEGMNPTNLVLFYKDPVITTEEIDGKSYNVYTYERIKFYFENNALMMWDRTKTAFENQLVEGYNSLKKAAELDVEGKLNEKLLVDFNKLKVQLKKNGINTYYRGNKEGALDNFELVLTINKLPVSKGIVDTLMIQYAGIIAREINQTERAIMHYKELASVDNQPNTYLLIKEDYLKLKDTVNAIVTLETAFEKYPDTLNVVANLVDMYIRTNQIDKGLKVIDAALAKNPGKGELYYWKGRLQLNLPDEDRITQALASYNSAIEKSPDLYYAYYDIGYIYFLQGQDLFTRAGDEKDKAYREQMINLGTENYQKALPNMEKALELNTSNKDIQKETLDTLKRLYYKLQMTEKYEEASEKLRNL
jgi:tetratricopeptide (TPR) repeat protein